MAKQHRNPEQLEERDPTAPLEPPPLPAVIEDIPTLAPADGAPRATWFSWPVGVGEGRLLNASVRLCADKKLLDMIGEEITVNRVIAYREDIPDRESGEVHRLTAIVLLSPAGESYKCHSVGIQAAIRELLIALPSAPWAPALRLRVEERVTRSGKRMLWLRLIGLAE